MARIYIASVFFLGVFGGMIPLKNSRSCIKASLCSGSRSGASNLLLSQNNPSCVVGVLYMPKSLVVYSKI